MSPVVEGLTLSIDCGGLGIKASVFDSAGTAHAAPIRIETPYPFPPTLFIKTLVGIAQSLPKATRATIGMPGMIRHGVVIATPQYITSQGPRTRIDPELREQWSGFDAQAALTSALGVPTLVLNDAEVHGAGVISGTGFEVVLTLGTGLGCAVFDGGKLSPHIEFSHAPIRRGTNYDTWIGEHERRRLGNAFWSRRVRLMIDDLRPVFLWDRLYLGGGNSRLITPELVRKIGSDVVVVPNEAGMSGGVRAWSLRND